MLLGALLDVAAEFFVFSDVLGKAGSQVPWCVTSLVVGGYSLAKKLTLTQDRGRRACGVHLRLRLALHVN